MATVAARTSLEPYTFARCVCVYYVSVSISGNVHFHHGAKWTRMNLHATAFGPFNGPRAQHNARIDRRLCVQTLIEMCVLCSAYAAKAWGKVTLC